MWQIERRIDIPQSTGRVFAYLAQFDNIREWDPSVLTARQISPGNRQQIMTDAMLRVHRHRSILRIADVISFIYRK